MEKILIIEDDNWILLSLKLYLENSDFEVITHSTWDNAINTIIDNNPNLVILDINLPVKNWMDICRELREKSQIPVIMLTARNTENDKLQAFDYGADDYIQKPFSPKELLARVQSIIRRTKKNDEKTNILKFWKVEIDLDKMKVKVQNKEVFFTKNEFDILKKIIKWNWKVVTREDLMDIIWYNEYLFDRTIDTHIKNIRKKIEIKDMILTIRWEWYRLNN